MSVVFISHSSDESSYPLPLLTCWAKSMMVKQAMKNREPKSCLAAWWLLEGLSDEDWDTIAPMLVEEIAILHDLFGDDDERSPVNH
jgi:hypothetical protein